MCFAKPEIDERFAKESVHTVEGLPEKSRLTPLDMLHNRLNEEFEQIYNLALTLTVENDHATVVRVGPPETERPCTCNRVTPKPNFCTLKVKNGFHSPSAGGYCDLKPHPRPQHAYAHADAHVQARTYTHAHTHTHLLLHLHSRVVGMYAHMAVHGHCSRHSVVAFCILRVFLSLC